MIDWDMIAERVGIRVEIARSLVRFTKIFGYESAGHEHAQAVYELEQRVIEDAER